MTKGVFAPITVTPAQTTKIRRNDEWLGVAKGFPVIAAFAAMTKGVEIGGA
ncbi:MAG: hypothetical protein J4G01_04320 [Dehalococcoidia bacterium]|nr:hypothetical protein [Dehalococcoidia bacterium]